MSDLSSLSGKTTRFAPSITGYLHLGHLYHLLILEKLYRDTGVKVLVRLEDHDTLRSRKDYEMVILDLLDWFGFEFFKDSPEPIKQSDRNDIYEEALAKISTSSVFKCTCTRSRLKNLSQNKWYEYHYDGNCLENPPVNPKEFGWRVLFDNRLMEASEFTSDKIIQNPFQQIHSSILKNHIGQWSYQFAVVVDDIAQGVDLVVRGKDVIHTTGRYLQIANLLGVDFNPVFLHHPLVYDQNNQKLSKRFESDAIHNWRLQGQTQEQIIGKLMKSLNSTFKDESINVKEFIASISL